MSSPATVLTLITGATVSTRTSCAAETLLPAALATLTLIFVWPSCRPFRSAAGTVVCHLPLAPTVAVYSWPFSKMVTFWPASIFAVEPVNVRFLPISAALMTLSPATVSMVIAMLFRSTLTLCFAATGLPDASCAEADTTSRPFGRARTSAALIPTFQVPSASIEAL